ncbi:MAG: energy transducer TonB [Labilithrix sp.]|nr:energy transducer TonB [Labilithrix sp.]MCW5814632.1 energy transducer TonB [Labilithrix sp.]
MAKAGARQITWPLAGSVVLHVLLVGGAGVLAYRSITAKEAREAERRAAASPPSVIAIELPGVAEGTLLADREVIPEGEEPTTFGGATVARVDNGLAGSGGDARGERATNLAALDDRRRLDQDLTSHLDKDQVQRLNTARVRATREDRRSTKEPMELTFLASGKGDVSERRPDAPSDPSRGSLHASAPSVLGGHVGSANDDDPSAPGSSAGASRAGALLGSPGVGLRAADPGADHHAGARITHARPSVAEAAPSIPALRDGRPNDTVDSDQEVSNTVRSLVAASAAGANAGAGRGGTPGPDADPGAGGGAVSRGSIARPLGSGDGDLVDWNTSDPTLLPYFRRIHAKVDPLWANAFPRSAMLELKQGTVILDVTIASDGTAKVTWPPARPSGIDEFDRNCADALRRASPFDPIPQAIKDRGYTTLRIRAPFTARNPIIQ